MNESDTLAERLDYWMRIRGDNGKRLANKTVALRAGLNETAIRDILNGKSKSPTLKTILRLCEALEILPHELSPELKALYPPGAQATLDKIAKVHDNLRDLRADGFLQDNAKPKK